MLLAPGFEIDLPSVKIDTDVELPVYQSINDNQLVAPALFKVTLTYMFLTV